MAVPRAAWVASNDLAFAIPDGFPVSRGHTLVVPRRVVATWFEVTLEEQRAILDLVAEVKALFERQLSPPPDGWNVGFNAGAAAGQTVPHLHVHVIPRWHGDVPDPRGGVRHVIPGRGNYLADASAGADLSTGHPDDPFLGRLLPELPGARQVDILAAFVQDSGIDLIEEPLLAAVREGAVVRVLAGDYLGISTPIALQRLLALCRLADPAWPTGAGISLRVAETARLRDSPVSFHPKSWRIRRDDRTIVWVGSSNLSHAALLSGVEWNLRATSANRPDACAAVAAAFESLWSQATAVDEAWIATYAQRRGALTAREVAADVEPSPLTVEPRPWQTDVLDRLRQLRARGHRRALAAVATGMGKTVLAALDAAHVSAGVSGHFRVLVVAHRAEILVQAARTLRHVLGLTSATESWCLGSAGDLSGQLVLASVQKLSRPDVLTRLANEHFDYAIFDEVHHAEAPTWRRVLDRLQASFVLGLTATPERADGRDVAVMFDDVLACEVGIAAGIAEGSLVPFAYRGLRDDVDYEQIPWRSGRFDPGELERRLIDSPRMERLWFTWGKWPAARTLVFCCSQRHARFVSDWLTQRGARAAAVFCGDGSDDRSTCLRDLADGRLQALCTVDLFNEGVDLPTVDRIVMLRPTESSVLFTQQLGRGLRTAPGKDRLTVVDFVGNHRVFGWRLRHLLTLGGLDGSVAELRRLVAGKSLQLPPGCLIDVELEAKAILEQLLPRGGLAVVEAYRGMRDELGRRPTPLELFHRGLLPSTLRRDHDGWFAFLESEGDLTDAEHSVLQRHGKWLRWVETTAITKSYKMVVLRVLIDGDALLAGQHLLEHAAKARAYMLAHPNLRDDLRPTKEVPDHAAASIQEWAAWWQRWPIEHSEDWLSTEGGHIVNRLRVEDSLAPALVAMTSELVDWRLGKYVARRLQPPQADSFDAKVSHSGRKPILFLPTAGETAGRPVGPTTVVLPDGQSWEFRFVRVACNVAHPAGEDVNRLPDLMRAWFGDQAGLPGTDFHVRFTRSVSGWTIVPLAVAGVSSPRVAKTEGAPVRMVAELPAAADTRRWVPVIDLAAAASEFSDTQQPEPKGWLELVGRQAGKGAFVAQVRGRSMEPAIPDGAWCLFRRIVPGSREGKVLLVQHRDITDPESGGRYTVKRYRSRKVAQEESWRHAEIVLEPDNPEFGPIAIDPLQADDLRVIAELVAVID